MSVIQRRSTATPNIPAIAVLAVALIIVTAIAIVLYRKSRGPFRRSPSPALNLSTDQPTARPASWFQPIFSILPEVPQSPRPRRGAQNPLMRSELHNTSHRNFGQPVPGTANSKAPVQGSATRSTTRTTQPLPGTSSTVTMFKVPTSEPVRPLPPTPSKLPPVRKATLINTNGVPYPAYISPSSTATAARTRTASNTPSPPPQQPHSANRSLASASTLRNPTSTKTLRNLFSTTTTHAPLSTFNSQTRTLRSPISDHDIQPAQQDHPALRHPASSPSLPHTKPTSLPPTLLQPLPFPLTSDTTDLSTELAPLHEQANLGYKNQPIINNTQTPPPPTQSQPQSHTKPSSSSSSSRPLVNSTYANFLTTRMQNASSSSPITLTPHSASLAALLVGSEAGTTDAGSGDGGGGGRTPDMNNNNNNNNNKRTDPVPGLIDVGRGCRGAGKKDGVGEVEERCRRFRDTGGFADKGDEDDDPVGRPWGRFDGKIEIVRDRDGERDDGGGGIGIGVGPLRVGGKNLEGRRG